MQCTGKASYRGTHARKADLITIAMDTAPLGSDVATMINVEVKPLKLLFTAQILAFFLRTLLPRPPIELRQSPQSLIAHILKLLTRVYAWDDHADR